MFRPFRRQEPEWVLTRGEPDHGGRPQVLCRRGGLEYCFRQGRRQERHVWLCYRRRKLFFDYILEEAGRHEAEDAAKAAADLLHSIEPSLEVFLGEN